MPVVAGSAGPRHAKSSLLLTIVFFLSPLVTCAAPRLAPFSFAIVGLALIGTALLGGTGWRDLLPRTPALVAWLVLVAYVFLNASWAAERGAALGKAALLAGVVLMTFAAASAAATLDAKSLRRAALAFAAGAFLGGAFMVLELCTDGAATRTAMNAVPLLRSESAKHVRIADGAIAGLNRSKLNQNVTLVMFHLWPGLLILTGLGMKGVRRTVAPAIFFITLAFAIAISEHKSSQVALIGSGLVLLSARLWPRPVIRALTVLWCAAFVLVIPVDFLAYRAGLHLAPWLPDSARARVILWEYTAERALTHPWLGIGVNSTSALKDEDNARLRPKSRRGSSCNGPRANMATISSCRLGMSSAW